MPIQSLPTDGLADLRPILRHVLIPLLVGRFEKGLAGHLARNAVRLADQAVADYRAGHRHLKRFVDDNNIGAFFGAQGRFEAAVISLHRFRGCFQELRRLGMTLADGSTLIPRPTECEFLRDPVGAQLTCLRDAIVHLDERLRKTPHRVGEPIALDLGNSGLYLDGCSLSWSAFTRYLRQAHQLAGRFSLTLSGSRNQKAVR
jgi:hypothetical protein